MNRLSIRRPGCSQGVCKGVTPRRGQPSAGRSEDGTPRWTEGIRRPVPVRSPTCSPTERGMWSAHRAVLLGSIPARRLHPPREEVGLEVEGLHPGHSPTLARRTHRRRLVRRWRSLVSGGTGSVALTGG